MLAVLQVLLGAGVGGLTQSIGVCLGGVYACFIFAFVLVCLFRDGESSANAFGLSVKCMRHNIGEYKYVVVLGGGFFVPLHGIKRW